MAKVGAPKNAPSFHIPGNFIRQTFVREYKAKGNSEAEAIAKFEALIKSAKLNLCGIGME